MPSLIDTSNAFSCQRGRIAGQGATVFRRSPLTRPRLSERWTAHKGRDTARLGKRCNSSLSCDRFAALLDQLPPPAALRQILLLEAKNRDALLSLAPAEIGRQAGIDGHALPADQAFLNAVCDGRLELVPQQFAVTEPTVPVLGPILPPYAGIESAGRPSFKPKYPNEIGLAVRAFVIDSLDLPTS